jgi:hypothetical protein
MSKPLIGVLGCGGEVGRVACEILQPSCQIRGGQRHPPKPSKGNADFEWVPVDLYNSGALAEFCRGCAVVLNCAAPSYQIGHRVALEASRAGALYVDTFGADLFEQSIAAQNGHTDGVFVISAGVFPGLSGMLPLWMAGQGFESVESLHAFAGGRELCSAGAGADLLLSTIAGFGIPDAYWRDGAVVRDAEPLPEAQLLPGFRGEVIVRRFLNSETIRIAERLKLREVHWHSVSTDEQVVEAISKCCSRLTQNGGNDALETSVAELVAISSMVLDGRSPWYSMMIELQGALQGKVIRKRAILRSADSYRLSGVVAAVTVQSILQVKPADGLYWAFEIVNPDATIRNVLKSGAASSLDVVEIPPADKEAFLRETEVGIL